MYQTTVKNSHSTKYKNHKVTYNGIKFDSKKEYERYIFLAALQEAGVISNLRRQVKYELIPSQKVNGKVVERACSYIADFVYERDGELVVEDTKGVRTDKYIIKRKLMLFVHGIQIHEV